MNRKIVMRVIAVAVIGGVALALFTPAPSVNKKITSTELTQLQGGGAWLVDVRTNAEFVVGHIPNSLSTPIDQLSSTAATWSKTQPIIVYGATSAQSERASSLLVSLGFKTIYSLDGGATAWTGPVIGGQAVASAPKGPAVVETNGRPVFIDFAGST